MKFTRLDIGRARVNKGLRIPTVGKIRDNNTFPCRNMNELIIMQVYTNMIYSISSERKKHEISFFKFIDLFSLYYSFHVTRSPRQIPFVYFNIEQINKSRAIYPRFGLSTHTMRYPHPIVNKGIKVRI